MKRAKLNNSRTSHAINRLDRQKATKPQSTRATEFTVAFFQRNARTTPNKDCQVYVLVTYGHDRLSYSAGMSCKPGLFDQSTGTVKNNAEHSKILAAIKAKANECYAEMKLSNRPIDLQIIKAYSLDIDIQGIPSMLECLELFWNERIETGLKIGDLEKGSYLKLRGWHGHLSNFIRERHGLRPPLMAIVPADAKACVDWLREKKNHSNDVAMRITSHLKRVLEFATANEWIQRNPFLMFRKKMQNKRQESLTIQEVEAIENAAIASDVLNLVRDIFLFCCYTGLGYSEVSSLTPSNITEINGQKCIIQVRDKIRKKTNLPSVVPLGKEALLILERYRNHPASLQKGVCLPVQANQKINAYLKQIQHVTGIKKRLTTHVARRTAATYYLNAGMPLTSVSALLGHSDTATTTRHYTTVTPETVVRDFQAIKRKTKLD
jgi:site-specific recombinase XerD